MTGVYQIEVKDKTVYKYLDEDNEIAQIIRSTLKNRRKLNYFNDIIRYSYSRPHIGKHIVKGYLHKKRGDYVSPLINGYLLSKLPNNLKTTDLISLLFSYQELLLNLLKVKREIGEITGDWTFHNIVWDNRSGHLVNIDLEGFFTYNRLGPTLPWEKKENKYAYIKKIIKRAEVDTFRQLKSYITKIKDIPYITIIYQPNNPNINWVFPLYLKNLKPNLIDYTFYIDFGDLIGYKCETFRAYYIINGQDNISLVILSDTYNFKSPNYRFLFSFKAAIEPSYEHPIPIVFDYSMKKPFTTKLIVKNEGEIGNIYINKFHKYL